jgi:hypothetical protein
MRNFGLKERQNVVQTFWTTVNEGGARLADLPRIVRLLLERGEIWRKREVDGRIVAFETLREFVTTPPRNGCGWDPEKVALLLKDDPATEADWREATKLPPGTNQYTMPKMVGDNVPHHKAKKGNSRAYTLSRLKRERPDLFDMVKVGKMSANAAAKKAGFRKPPKHVCPKCGHEWRK